MTRRAQLRIPPLSLATEMFSWQPFTNKPFRDWITHEEGEKTLGVRLFIHNCNRLNEFFFKETIREWKIDERSPIVSCRCRPTTNTSNLNLTLDYKLKDFWATAPMHLRPLLASVWSAEKRFFYSYLLFGAPRRGNKGLCTRQICLCSATLPLFSKTAVARRSVSGESGGTESETLL